MDDPRDAADPDDARPRPEALQRAVSGAVLAGGGSRRMGRDKRWMEIDGVPLLVRAIVAVAEVADDTHVVTSSSQDADTSSGRLPETGAAWTVDRRPGQGPLAGIEAALAAARHDLVLIVASDQPFVEPEVLRLLATRLEAAPSAHAAAIVTDRGPQPLLAVYRRSAMATVSALLDGGERRARALLEELGDVVLLDAHDWQHLDDGRSAIDLDTPADAAAHGASPPDITSVGAAAAPPTDARFARDDGTAGPTSAEGTDATAEVADRHRAAQVAVLAIGPDTAERDDLVAVEEPLEIRAHGPGQEPVTVVTTLRTPGHDADLAIGWLFSEALLRPGDVEAIAVGDAAALARPDDQLTVRLRRPLELDRVADRHTAATASCGICGRATIDELAARTSPVPAGAHGDPVRWSTVVRLPELVRDHQRLFAATGGLHAAALVDRDGAVAVLREDVGRHNALDAAIGACVRAGRVPLHRHLAVLSGRIGFELVAKAAVAGVPIVVAVGAPTDLAVRTADRLGITLVGFVRAGSGNIYTHRHRLDVDG